jgi:hypothetical protein
VWADLSRISSHVEWMADAVAIAFEAEQHEGVGTAFETDTRVGPFRLKDRMVVTEWEPGRVMGIRHTGVVTGIGRFTLEEIPGEGTSGAGTAGVGASGDGTAGDGAETWTRFTWEEVLHFPAWMGGSLGSRAGGPILKRIWAHNLENLRRRFE